MDNLALYSNLIDMLATHISDVCANCKNSLPDFSDFYSKNLLDGDDVIAGKFYPGAWSFLEPPGYGDKNAWPFDSGIINYLLFGRPPPANGQFAKTVVERIGIDGIISSIDYISIERIKDILAIVLSENNLGVVNYYRISKNADEVKKNIISVGNLYYFAKVFSRFIYENIILIISPDAHKHYYIFKPNNSYRYNIPFAIDTAVDFKSMSDEDKKDYLTKAFKEIFAVNDNEKKGKGLFVQKIYSCSYEISVLYANTNTAETKWRKVGQFEDDTVDDI